MSTQAAIGRSLKQLLENDPPRAGSLIVTVFGDSISLNGNSVWLGSLINVLAPFGINARQIRTAVFRLHRDAWLSCTKIGRKSFYSFTDFALAEYQKSARRIYASKPAAWDGQWTLVIANDIEIDSRAKLKRELSWQGFAAVSGNIFAHPRVDELALNTCLKKLDISDRVIVMRAFAAQFSSESAARQLADDAWQLGEIARRYAAYTKTFTPLTERFAELPSVDPAQAFAAQTLAIHAYRRILLKTPDLPAELEPEAWPGRQALNVAATLYQLLLPATMNYLEDQLDAVDGSFEPSIAAYSTRFA